MRIDPFLLPRAPFWRIWGTTAVAVAVFLLAVLGAAPARADEDLLSPQAFFRQEAGQDRPAPDAFESVRTVGRFAHRHILAPALIAGQAATREAVRGAGGVVGEAMRFLGRGNPTGTGSHNWCGDFAQFVLAKAGHRTVHSRLARDAVHAGRPISGPVPGAIMSLPHHTGFVVRVLGPGRVLLISGNHSHRVGLGVYSTRGARFAMPA